MLPSVPVESKRGGIRNAEKKYPSIQTLVNSVELVSLAGNYISGTPKKVRVIYFDKTPEKNWLVSWHQDRTVALSNRFEMVGWRPWSLKDGSHHVQPPIDILKNMITLHIHIDESNETNRCLKVIPGTHKYGILNQETINQLSQTSIPLSCVTKPGDVLIMRPHLLHSSRKGSHPDRRRIIHVEYCGTPLPLGGSWA